MKRLSKKDKIKLFNTLQNFIEFAEWQEREGNVDGVCDPSFSLDCAKTLIQKYAPEMLCESKYVEPV